MRRYYIYLFIIRDVHQFLSQVFDPSLYFYSCNAFIVQANITGVIAHSLSYANIRSQLNEQVDELHSINIPSVEFTKWCLADSDITGILNLSKLFNVLCEIVEHHRSVTEVTPVPQDHHGSVGLKRKRIL